AVCSSLWSIALGLTSRYVRRKKTQRASGTVEHEDYCRNSSISGVCLERSRRRRRTSVPVEYHGEQIHLAGRFEKPAIQGPLPTVILLHNCAGVDRSSSLAVWAPLMRAQGYATLRLDSFTARGYHNVCDNPGQVRAGDRAQDVFAAVFLLAARPDVR